MTNGKQRVKGKDGGSEKCVDNNHYSGKYRSNISQGGTMRSATHKFLLLCGAATVFLRFVPAKIRRVGIEIPFR